MHTHAKNKYTCTRVFTNTHKYRRTHIYMCIHASTHTQTHFCMHVYPCVFVVTAKWEKDYFQVNNFQKQALMCYIQSKDRHCVNALHM